MSIREIVPSEGEEVEKKSAVDKFYGMMKIPRKLADEIIDMEMWIDLISTMFSKSSSTTKGERIINGRKSTHRRP